VRGFLQSIGENENDVSMPMKIQPMHNTGLYGTAVRHPNMPEVIHVELTSVAITGQIQGRDHLKVYENGEIYDYWSTETRDDESSLARLYADMIRRLEQLNCTSPEYAYKIEFGGEDCDARLFQVGPFMKRETANFRIETGDSKKYVFGITPRDGICLPVVRILSSDSTNVEFANLDRDREEVLIRYVGSYFASPGRSPGSSTAVSVINKAMEKIDQMYPDGYCLVMNSYRNEGYLDFFMQNARALLVGDQFAPLSHGAVRLIQKVPLVGFNGKEFHKFKTGDIVRIRSDGNTYSTEKV